MADFATRSMGIGYAGGSLLLFTLVLASLGVWYRTRCTIAAESVASPRAELHYRIPSPFHRHFARPWVTGSPIPSALAISGPPPYSPPAWLFSSVSIHTAGAASALNRTLLTMGKVPFPGAKAFGFGSEIAFSRPKQRKSATVWKILSLNP